MVLRITVRPLGAEPPPTLPGGSGDALAGSLDTTPAASADPWDAVLDERQIESGLIVQARARKKAEALQTLDEIAPPPAPAAASEPAPADTPSGDAAAAEDARAAAAARTAVGVASPQRTQAPEGGTTSRISRDLARGATEAPRQILGGVRDAAQAAINFGDWIADNLEAIAPLGGFQVFNDKGEFAPARIPAGDPRLAAEKTGVTLPDVKKPTTVTGSLVRGVSQFLAGFAAAGPAAGAITSATVPRAMIQGALADFAAFEAHDQRLSNLIEDFPALKNPVTDFLAAKPDDNEAAGRFKRAIEGLGLGVTAEGMIRAVRYVRDAKRAAAAADPEAAAARAPEPVPPPSTLLGDENAPALVRIDVKRDPKAEARANAGKTEGEFGVPDDVAARAITDKGLTPLSEGKDGVYVNFAAIKTSEQVHQVIADTAAAFKDDITAAQRGVRTHQQTAMAAAREDAWKLLESRRAGQPLNAEQSLAARRLWEGSTEKLIEVAEGAALAPTPENLFAFRRMMAIHKDIQTEVLAARTETARALNAWAIPVGGATKARMASIDNLLLTYGGPEASALLARKVAALKNLPEGAAVLDDVVAKGAFAKTTDVAKEVWINALLSNPKTHIVNMLGNTIGLGQELIERMAAGVFSRAIGSGQILPGEAMAKFFALNQGMREGFWLAKKALATGESQFGAQTTKTAESGFERAISSAHLGADPANWFGWAADGLGNIVNMPVRFLTAEDDFFKAIGYRAEVAAQAFRQASREAADGTLVLASGGQPVADAMRVRIANLMANPSESIKLAATDYARYMTYTNEPGAFVLAVNRLDRQWMASSNPGAQIASLSMRIMIPFRNTPANLVTYAFERTPLAPLMSRYREAIAKGGADADLARTRMALGTMAAFTLMDLALDGHITGAGPKDDKDRGTRDTMQRAGWQPYSVRIGDRYFSYRRTDPLGISLGIAGDIAELVNNAALDEDKQEDILRLVAGAAASFGNQMLDKTYLSSVSDLIDVLHKPDKAGSFVERRVASFEPAVAGEARRQIDPYMRYTMDLATEIRNRTPGLSGSLPVARDVWGRPKTFQSGMGTVYDAISPIASRKFDPMPIDREALANDFNLAPPTPMLSFGAGLSVSLRKEPEAYSRYLELRGQVKPSAMGVDLTETNRRGEAKWKYGDVALLPLLNAIVSGEHPLSAKYEAAGGGRNGGKDAMITRIVADYGRVAKARLLEEFPSVAARLERKAGRIEQ